MELYVKAGPDGTSIGDCPFSHYVAMVLYTKGLDCKTVPCSSLTKPTWLIESGGGMPCFVHNGNVKEAIKESSQIAAYINNIETSTSIPCSTVGAQHAVDGLFPSIAKFLKNTDEVQSSSSKNVEATLLTKLEILDEFLESTNTGLMSNDMELGLDDYSLIPKLYHLVVAGRNFKEFVIPENLIALQKYMKRVFALPVFIETAYPKSFIIWGWGNARS